MSEVYSLKWNDFQSVVYESFSKLRQNADFSDLTLVSDDHTQISAHKIVLAASSDFFKSILKQNPHSHPLLYLGGVDSRSLACVLDYIYSGEVLIHQNEVDNFLEVAHKLKIRGYSETEVNEIQLQLSQPEKNNEIPESVNDFENPPPLTSTIYPEHSPLLLPPPSPLPSGLLRIHSSDTTDHMSISFSPPIIKRSKTLNDKIMTLMMKKNGKFHCLAPYCDYSSVKSGHMKEHVESNHISGVSYPCQICHKIYKSRAGYRIHFKREHLPVLRMRGVE